MRRMRTVRAVRRRRRRFLVATRPPLDLHADAAAEPTRERTNIGDEMLSSMKSVFRHPAEVIQSWSKKPLID